MSKKLKLSFEELVETPINAEAVTAPAIDTEVEQQRLALEIDEDSQEIDRQSELVEGLECLAQIASKLDTPTPEQIALFRVTASFAVKGTDKTPQSFLPAMESNKPIALEGFIDKAKEIIKAIIAKLKEWWDKIVEFFKSIFNKEKKVQEFDNNLNREVKVREEEIKKNNVEIVLIKTPEPVDIYESSKKILEDNAPIEPIKSSVDTKSTTSVLNDKIKEQIELQKKLNEELKKILLPEKVEIYNKNSKIFPKTDVSSVWVYMEKGNYLGEVNIFLNEHIKRVARCKAEIRSGFSALEVNILDLDQSLEYYLKSEDNEKDDNEETLNIILAKIKRNLSDILNKFIRSYGNSDLLTLKHKGAKSESYHYEIIGGYGFQTILNDKDVVEINFNNAYDLTRLVEEKCVLELKDKVITACIGHRGDLIKNLIADNKSFNSFVTNKMDLNAKVLDTLDMASKYADLNQAGLNIINETKTVLISIDKFILTLNKFNSFMLDALYDADVIANRVLNLYK